MTIDNYEYIKDDGEISNRKLHIVGPPPAANLRAIDLTGFDDETAAKIVFVYDEWMKKVKKPFDKKARDFQKEHLMSFEDYLREHDFVEVPDTLVKSFKEHGLKKVPA